MVPMPSPTHFGEVGLFNAQPYVGVGEAFADLPALCVSPNALETNGGTKIDVKVRGKVLELLETGSECLV